MRSTSSNTPLICTIGKPVWFTYCRIFTVSGGGDFEPPRIIKNGHDITPQTWPVI